MTQFTFYMLTLGCRVNQYETEFIRSQWEKAGGVECGDMDNAQYICINSCAVTSNAERESRNAIYRARRSNPEAYIIMTGCAARLFNSFRPRKNAFWAEPDAIICNKNDLLAGPKGLAENSQDFFPPGILETSRHSRPVVKAQDGCDRYCAYCIVPGSRGKPKSRHPQAILAEISSFLARGWGEVVLSGINLHLYGKDNEAYGDFWDLLNFLETALAPSCAGNARIRLSSIDPGLLNGKGLEAIAQSRLLCPHLHLSIQHGSSGILKKMNRGHYSAAMILDKVGQISSSHGIFGLGADFIAGFPGETESDFGDLLDLIKNLPLSYAHIFPFSSRPGTRAAKFPNQIPRKVKNERAAIARKLLEEKRAAFLESLLKLKNVQIAAEAREAETGKGLNEYYIPCYFQNFADIDYKLFRARPIKPHKDGLWVEPCD